MLRAQGTAHALYFGLVILLGSFYLLNLILAIVAMSYNEQQKQDAVDAEEEAVERMVSSLIVIISSDLFLCLTMYEYLFHMSFAYYLQCTAYCSVVFLFGDCAVFTVICFQEHHFFICWSQ